MTEHNREPSKRVAQHTLAREVLQLVHGPKVAEESERQHRALFQRAPASIPTTSTDNRSISPHTPEQMDNAVSNPIIDKYDKRPFHNLVLPKSLVYKQPISRMLYHAGMVKSRSEGHRLVNNQGVYLGALPSAGGTMGNQLDFSPAFNWQGNEIEKYTIGGDTLILRVGKWNVKIIKIISDEEYEAQGLTCPGWKEQIEEKPLTEDLTNMKAWHSKGYVKNAKLHQKSDEPVKVRRLPSRKPISE